jgi:glycosyltransferase involved in cell wall biosynthesis
MNTEQKHIALFLLTLDGGGAERVIVNLAKAFTGDGYRVDIVLAKKQGVYLAEVPDVVSIVDLHAPRVLACLPALLKYLNNNKPQALLAAGHHTNLIAIWAAKLAKVKPRVFVSEHNTLSYSINHRQNLRDRLLPILMRCSYKSADGIIAVSAGVADDLATRLKINRDKIDVIYNPIVDQELLRKAEYQIEHPWFKPGQPPVIISAGRFVELKDFPTLIKAFAIVREKYPVRLLLLGEGDKRGELEQLVRQLGMEDDVFMPGFVNNPYAYMKKARVFVLSSKWEGLSNVLIEAMACGTLLISTDCPSGPREILEDGKYGLLVPVGNEKAMAEAILKALKNQPQKGSWSERVKDFSVDHITSKYLDLMLGNVLQD